METIEISKAELKRELFEDVLFVQLNEAGAMDRDAGTVCVVKPDGKFYRISFVKGDISLRDIEEAFPAMREWNFGVCVEMAAQFLMVGAIFISGWVVIW